MIDIIVSPAVAEEKLRFQENAPKYFKVSTYSKEGIQASLPLAEMRQTTGFNQEIASDAFKGMKRLVNWYLEKSSLSAMAG